jgi:glutathione S-transferase|uniref:Glutathione S-transferase epsilon n=1 Tax=Tenebrio molitor TaxID=7067 RepID=A0A077CXE8_TENMO|nr:glutathione S-transferase epsilon [Tenebrio molitor]
MAPILYVFPPSPAARSVLMTAKAIGLNLQVKPLDFFKGEHLTPEYLEMNPQHTVPTLVDDDGFTFWDSHAINAYLVSRYGKSDDLYPRDIKRRGVVNQRLHFDSGVASTTGSRVIFGILNDSKTSVDQEDVDNVNQVYAWLDEFLKGKLWMAGDSVTIADYNLFASTTNLNIIVPIDAKKYPRVAAWVKKLESRPEAEGNKKGLALLVTMIKSKLS